MKNFFIKLTRSTAALLLLTALLAPSVRAGVFEPDTIFYGQIVNRTSGQADQLTAGTLTWTIGTPSGTPIVLTTQVHPYNLGQYSYQLAVPHEALTYGLTVSSNAVPLTAQLTTYSHIQISVDGNPATILAPGSSTFSVDQAVRASTYRLDLELNNSLASTSGDGIPDWWKAKYGAIDPNADPDHDGWSNLQEFLHGTDPTHDDRIPSLGTTELFVYADATTGVHLQVNDSDSAPAQVKMTLTAIPSTGTLYLRNTQTNAASPNTNLVVGSSFTADDVANGRLIYVYNSTNDAVPTSFSVNLVDENPVHTNSATVTLNVYRPFYAAAIVQSAEADAAAPVGFADISGLAFYEQQMLINYYLGHDGKYLIWDESRMASAQQLQVPSSGLDTAGYAAYVASFGHDYKNVFVGGAGNDRLVGGAENDIFIGGNGADTLRGNGGSDLFVIPGPNSGNDTIEDFSTNDLDVLDISRVLTGAAGLVTNYVKITSLSTNSYLNINYSGVGTNFTNMIITLQNTHFAQSDLQALMNNGNLVTGNKVFSPTISVTATVPAASQNGPSAGVFTFTRTGPTAAALSVNFTISGNAVNGTDYQVISSPVSFAAGQRAATVSIMPYVNANTFTNVVQVTLQSAAGYDLGASTAQVTIEPLAPQISIEAIQPVAVRTDGSIGTFLVSRAGIVNSSVLVRFTISGTASNGVDYVSTSAFVNFAPQQTTALINITPKSTANLTNGSKFAQFTIVTTNGYKIMGPSYARVIIVDQMMDLAAWQARYFPTNHDASTSFAQQDAGGTGIRNILRYAFGLNAVNPLASTSGKPVFSVVNGHLCVSFREPTSVTDIAYTVQVSDDLITWRSSDSDVQQIAPLQTSDVESVSWQSASPIVSGKKQFMRVIVNEQ